MLHDRIDWEAAFRLNAVPEELRDWIPELNAMAFPAGALDKFAVFPTVGMKQAFVSSTDDRDIDTRQPPRLFLQGTQLQAIAGALSATCTVRGSRYRTINKRQRYGVFCTDRWGTANEYTRCEEGFGYILLLHVIIYKHYSSANYISKEHWTTIKAVMMVAPSLCGSHYLGDLQTEPILYRPLPHLPIFETYEEMRPEVLHPYLLTGDDRLDTLSQLFFARNPPDPVVTPNPVVEADGEAEQERSVVTQSELVRTRSPGSGNLLLRTRSRSPRRRVPAPPLPPPPRPRLVPPPPPLPPPPPQSIFGTEHFVCL